MSKTRIETYRGIEIWFDTDNESFQCDIDDERSIKKSYPAVKKFIDEWKKENDTFKTIDIEPTPNSWKGKGKFKVVGIRKDGQFIIQDNSGKKSQLSKYDEDSYMLIDKQNHFLWLELQHINSKREELNKEEKEIKSKFKVTTVKDIKQNYL